MFLFLISIKNLSILLLLFHIRSVPNFIDKKNIKKQITTIIRCDKVQTTIGTVYIILGSPTINL